MLSRQDVANDRLRVLDATCLKNGYRNRHDRYLVKLDLRAVGKRSIRWTLVGVVSLLLT